MTEHATASQASPLVTVLEDFFEAKTARDVEGTMSFFSPDLTSYIDATLGWDLPGYDALKDAFTQYMANWPPLARSYATRILAGETSALVHMTDTPELFGGELRIFAAVDFAEGKIARWVDYWDASAYDSGLYAEYRTPADTFPRDLKESRIVAGAPGALVDAAEALQRAFGAADGSAAGELMHTDVVVEDRALRSQVIGRIEATRYLERVLSSVPYGRASELRHVVGGETGGGFEWTAGPDARGLVGITALELGPDGLVTKITSVYDSRQLEPARKAALVGASFA